MRAFQNVFFRPSVGAVLQVGGGVLVLALLFGMQRVHLQANRVRSVLLKEQRQAFVHSNAAHTIAAAMDGEEVYQERCATCHQVDGQGVPGIFPPLAGSEWVTGDKGRLIRIVLHGVSGEIQVKGSTYNGVMPGWGQILSNKEVAAVTTYVRTHWGNHAADVSVNEVQRVRSATRARTRPWTAQALKDEANTGIPREAQGAAEAPSARKETASGHPYPIELPELYRTFMPSSSPASIAVGLPGGQSYCFDAAVSYLRYAWEGGFVNMRPQWDGNGNAFTEIIGEVYYRNQVGFPLRFGTPEETPEVEFKGYRMVDGGYPEFHYAVGGVEIRELIKPRAGGTGLVRHFTVEALEGPLYFVTGGNDAGVAFEASAGVWHGDTLKLSPDQGGRFTITMIRTSDQGS